MSNVSEAVTPATSQAQGYCLCGGRLTLFLLKPLPLCSGLNPPPPPPPVKLQSDAVSREDLLSYVAAVEQNTTHPLAKAVVAHAKQEGSKLPQVESGTFQQVGMTFQQLGPKQLQPAVTLSHRAGFDKRHPC